MFVRAANSGAAVNVGGTKVILSASVVSSGYVECTAAHICVGPTFNSGTENRRHKGCCAAYPFYREWLHCAEASPAAMVVPFPTAVTTPVHFTVPVQIRFGQQVSRNGWCHPKTIPFPLYQVMLNATLFSGTLRVSIRGKIAGCVRYLVGQGSAGDLRRC